MNYKPTLVHIIDDLGRGGAETLLVDILPCLNEHFNVVLVTLSDYSDFSESAVVCKYRYNLAFNSKFGLIRAVTHLKKIIKRHEPVLVRSQLFWSTIIARLACPRNIPLVFSVHVTLSDAAFKFTKKGPLLKWLEKITYRKHQTMIGVTQEVVDDYEKEIGIKGARHILFNYVNDEYFKNSIKYKLPNNGKLRLVAVGNPKKQKNYNVILDAFGILNDPGFSCDIYGEGNLNEKLEREIAARGLKIILKGKASNISECLKNYDAFIMPSIFEGFGIAVAEAMAVGLPVFLSDIKVLREVSHSNGIFFNPLDAEELAAKIKEFKMGKYDANSMSEIGQTIAKENYSKSQYLVKLLSIYDSAIRGSKK